ncbi:MAG TPA: glycoside hydrolase domain-containing protein, partial [Planctomycetota bacterium]|nr:glycoside hydrolase domain-containing protein [Planctomycetota bacterium]
MALGAWLASSFVRHFPLSPACRPRPLAIDAALNEQFSFQACVRLDAEDRRRVRVEAAGPAGWLVRVRRVGYVPVLHHNPPVEPDPADVDGLGRIPGFVPDPLFDDDSLLLPPGETHAFWITVRPGPAATPGMHTIRVTIIPERGKPIAATARVRLHDVVLGERKGLAVTHWFYVDSLIDWYKTEMFDERFWQILPAYVRNVVEHGQDTLYVPVFTPPLDGVKRPCQLLRVRVEGGVARRSTAYTFDWSDVRRYIGIAKKCGVARFEWSHPFTQWGAQHAIRIYEGQGCDEKLLWPHDTAATSHTYREFLSQYLPQLRRFLADEKILGRSMFHVSDEPHGAEHLQNYAAARALLRELAPWMQTMDALSQIEFGRQHITDLPIPTISTALDFVNEGITCGCYYCCGPRGR